MEIGSISHGTMRNEDLLQTFGLALDAAHRTYAPMPGHEALVDEAYALTVQYSDDPDAVDDETASDVVNALFDALNCYAPDGCYFGAHEGDGSDYGFWPVCMHLLPLRGHGAACGAVVHPECMTAEINDVDCADCIGAHDAYCDEA